MSFEKFDVYKLPDGFFAPFDLKWLEKYYELDIQSVVDYEFYYNFDGSYRITFITEDTAQAFYNKITKKDESLPEDTYKQSSKNSPVIFERLNKQIIFQYVYRETLLMNASYPENPDMDMDVKNVNPFNLNFFTKYLGLKAEHIDHCTNENLEFKIKFKEEKDIQSYFNDVYKLGLCPNVHITHKMMCISKVKYNLMLFKLALDNKKISPKVSQESIFKSKLPSLEKIKLDSENTSIPEKIEIDINWFLEKCNVNKEDLKETSIGTFLWIIFKPEKVHEAFMLDVILNSHNMDYFFSDKTKFQIYLSPENFTKLNEEIISKPIYN